MYSQYTNPLAKMSWENYVHTNKQELRKTQIMQKQIAYVAIVTQHQVAFVSNKVCHATWSFWTTFLLLFFFLAPREWWVIHTFDRWPENPFRYAIDEYGNATPLHSNIMSSGRSGKLTGAHSDLREVGDRIVFPVSQQGRCSRASSGATWHCSTRYTPWKTWLDCGRGNRAS